jgi:GT2 family glycosyltransferase
MRLSIIIVNYNVRYFLEQCLRSVFKALEGVSAEVFVVDNASVDGSVEMIREKFPQVIVLANSENVGFSKANNQAIQISKGEYVLLLNPDTLVEEKTFHKILAFMDLHPDAGGLGVKMVDGKGVYLPESKRGLPTPFVSFCKISGLSSLFKKSAIFNRYHLGHLDKDNNHPVEILSGAFMWMRRRALEQVGLLDETFFMYGEDIDLSWRLILGGWKNYYFAETSIIHYKGESTKKGSLNYVYVFYRAMAIFAQKHFSQKNAGINNFFIHAAIWMRAAIAACRRILQGVVVPLFDIALVSVLWLSIKQWYSVYTGIAYNPQLFGAAMTTCISVWVFSLWMGGAYDRPLKAAKAIFPVTLGSAIILLVYSLLPESLRFSRALILIGTLVAAVIFYLNRKLLGRGKTSSETAMRTIVLGSLEETKRVRSVLSQTQINCEFCDFPAGASAGFFKPQNEFSFGEYLRIEKISQVVFCAADIDAATIISLMASGGQNIEYKIVPPEAFFIIGSGKINAPASDVVQDINSIMLPQNKRLKRCVDVVCSLVLLISLPVSMTFASRPLGVPANCIRVIMNRMSWVGRTSSSPKLSALHILKPGVIMPSATIQLPAPEEASLKRHLLYIKDYSPLFDVSLIWAARKSWGN